MVLRGQLSRWKADFFREPGTRGRYQLWVTSRWFCVLGLAFAAWVFYYALFRAFLTANLLMLAFATGGFSWSLAELLPRNRTTLAGVLRVLGWASFWIGAPLAIVIDIVL